MAADVPYHAASRAVREELARRLPRDELRRLHEASGWRHAAVALRQVALLAVAAFVALRFSDRWWAWAPATALIGLVVFDFTVLLHEVVHRAVFRRRRSPWNRVLAFLYAVPSGLSPTQFARWHLDHHDWLGTSERDPKRHHLTPKVVRRWYKALYLTPALFPIYFRAAAREAATYPEDVRRRIRRERLVSIVFHLAVLAGLWATLGPAAALRLHVLPVFVVFPVAFTVNRLGQHYDVVPSDPARWGTLLRPSPFWDRAFLWSNYHLEHHYFPRVPCYRLPRLRRLLEGFFRERGVRTRTYAGLLWDWFGRNRAPHTDWSV